MVNLTHLNRLAGKISKLSQVYRDFLVEDRVLLDAMLWETKDFFSEPPMKADYKAIQIGQTWGQEFGYGWFRCKFQYPESFKGRPVFLEKVSGGVEGLVFIDGKPYGMFDDVAGAKEAVFRLHKYLRLTDFADNQTVTLDIEDYASHTFVGTMPYEKEQTFSLNHLSENRVYKGIWLVLKRQEVDKFLDNLYFLTSLFKMSQQNSYAQAELLKDYQKLFKVLDFMPYDSYDKNSVIKANALFDQIFDKRKGGANHSANIGLIGHSHLDTAWLWTVSETVRKAARTAANAVNLLKRYPDYKFLMSTALYLKWFEDFYPTLFEDICELAKQGRFEFNGATWIECDCNLVGNEALVRQFVKGQLYLREKLGKEADCFWLPDTFGYSAALPQIMKQCNVPYFLTTKLSWNDTNNFPYDTFIWSGIDRSEVLAHFNTIQAFPDPETIQKRGDKLPNKHLSNTALIAYGYGDGGGGPDEKMVECALKTIELGGTYKNNHTTVSSFMKSIDKAPLPKYTGELYLELHRGTYTTNHDLKKGNRSLEIALHNAELLSVLKGVDFAKLKEKSDKIYETLLLNQFHDILPGTSITEVNTLAKKQNAEALNDANQMIDEIADATGEHVITLVNTLSFDREDYVSIKSKGLVPEDSQFFIDIDGQGYYCIKASIPAFSSVQINEGVVKERECKFLLNNKRLETPLYQIEFDDNMSFASIFDKQANRQIVKSGGIFNGIKLFDDVPNLWDNWDIDSDYVLKQCGAGKLLKSQVISCGHLQLRIRNLYKLTEKSQLIQDMVFYADSKRIDFENKVIWGDKHKLLKVYFESNIISNFYKSEIQFGYVERSTHRNNSVEQAQFEVCNQKWTDLSETNYGLSILNDCKYGISVEEGVLGLTLLKSGTHPDTTADIGTHYFRYSILPHSGGFNFENTVKPAYQFNYLPLQFNGGVIVDNIVKSTNQSVIIETVKIAENGKDVTLRLYESEGTGCNTVLNFDKPYMVLQTNMLEDKIKTMASTEKIGFYFSPFEIKTLVLKR